MQSRILGIDPGSRNMGWAVLELETGKLLGWGTIKTKPKTPQPETLGILLQALEDLIAQWCPHHLALEDLFFSRNVRSAMRVGEARGMVLLACHQHGLEPYSYTPQQLKIAAAGKGNASKEEIAEGLEGKFTRTPPTQHAGDAAAAAMCLRNEMLADNNKAAD